MKPAGPVTGAVVAPSPDAPGPGAPTGDATGPGAACEAPRTSCPADLPSPARAAATAGLEGPLIGPERLPRRWLAAGFLAVAIALVAGVMIGPVRLGAGSVVRELLRLPSGLSDTERTIVWQFRLPRVVLGLLVGAVLSTAGGAYQATFRNPLADPYLLGVAGGAGFGATLLLVSDGSWASPALVPLGAFIGGLVAMGLTYLLGAAGARGSAPIALVLAGVAVSAFFTAMQTYLQQRNQEDIRRVYSWILGRLSTSGWHDVLLFLPYAVIALAVLLAYRRRLDVLAVGDDEATSLGADPRRIRLIVVLAATLGTAAAVAVSGLIVFVGIIVPHLVRMLVGSSARVVLPLSLLFGAAFLAMTDLVARTVLAPAELPIGVVTAFLGAPFFVLVLRSAGRQDR